MPSKKDRIIALVKERGPVDDEAIYLAIRKATRRGGATLNEVRRAIVDEGGMMKKDGDDTFFCHTCFTRRTRCFWGPRVRTNQNPGQIKLTPLPVMVGG